MYTVMLVDDENIVHQGLKACVDWRKLECEVIHDAFDGIEALEKIARAKPDIILTDIKMPGMDGVAFTKQIAEQHPEIQVIMLTGFADIEYARKAMEYNVKSFILKPTETEEIQKAMEKAIAQIRHETERTQRIRNLEETLAHNRVVAREKFLSDILHGAIKDETHLLQGAQQVNLHLDAYLLLAAHLEESLTVQPELPQPFLKEKTADQIFLVDTILKNAFQPQLQYNIILNKHTLVSILHTLPLPLEPDVTVTNIAHTVAFLHQTLNVKPVIGLSAVHHGVETISQAYQEANAALKQRFFESAASGIFLYEAAAKPSENREAITIKQYTDQLLNLIQRQDAATLHQTVAAFFQEHTEKKATIDALKNNCIALCALCTNAVLTSYAFSDSESQINPHIYQQILESRTLTVLQQTVLTYLTDLFRGVPTQHQELNYIIQKARNFIQHHYQENLSLQTIAAAIFVNASYLSRLFHKETGLTITEAILHVRMEKAKELLRTSHGRIKEIAREVGYEDESYFSRSFKDYTGLSPKAYKDPHQQFFP